MHRAGHSRGRIGTAKSIRVACLNRLGAPKDRTAGGYACRGHSFFSRRGRTRWLGPILEKMTVCTRVPCYPQCWKACRDRGCCHDRDRTARPTTRWTRQGERAARPRQLETLAAAAAGATSMSGRPTLRSVGQVLRVELAVCPILVRVSRHLQHRLCVLDLHGSTHIHVRRPTGCGRTWRG